MKPDPLPTCVHCTACDVDFAFDHTKHFCRAKWTQLIAAQQAARPGSEIEAIPYARIDDIKAECQYPEMWDEEVKHATE